MSLRSTKTEVAVFYIALVLLVGIWAINGFEDTWLYATALIVATPVSWFSFGKKNDR